MTVTSKILTNANLEFMLVNKCANFDHILHYYY